MKVYYEKTAAISGESFVFSSKLNFDMTCESRYFDGLSGPDLWYNTARFFNDEGRFTQVDPLWRKYPSISPYVRVADNPLRFLDPTGLNVVNFDSNGVYTGFTEDDNGWDVVTANVGGTVYQFNDPNWNVDEMKSLIAYMNGEMGVPIKLALSFENEAMSLALKGIGGVDNIFDVFMSSLHGGSMDFAGGLYHVGQQNNSLFLINGIIYNGYDAGNYVWGGAMNLLGYGLVTAQAGAQFHNFFFDPNHRFTLDSIADQRAIRKGWLEMGKKR